MSDGAIDRRRFLLAGAASAAAGTAKLSVVQARTIQGEVPWAAGEADPPKPIEPGGYLYFTPTEAAFIEAAVARLIPADELGPGAREAGCPTFLDRQLAGAFGRAERWYMQGPWPKGTHSQGYQTRLTPAQIYRAAINGIDVHCRTAFSNKSFAELGPTDQDKVLSDLEDGKIGVEGSEPGQFFKILLQNTIEGFFADPLYGGNKDMTGWKMIGFPGARYDYRDFVPKHGQRYPLAPVALMGRPAWTRQTD